MSEQRHSLSSRIRRAADPVRASLNDRVEHLESELSLSLAREQRLRDEAEQAENEWSAYTVTLNQRLERLEALARRRGIDDVAISEALSSVPDGEGQ